MANNPCAETEISTEAGFSTVHKRERERLATLKINTYASTEEQCLLDHAEQL